MNSKFALVFAFILVSFAGLAAACNDSNSGPATTATPEGTRPPDDGSDQTDSPTVRLVELLRPSVVHIRSSAATLDDFGQLVPSSGVGTGFIIDAEGHIVTNNHVISINNGNPADDITVTLDDGTERAADCRRAATHRRILRC